MPDEIVTHLNNANTPNDPLPISVSQKAEERQPLDVLPLISRKHGFNRKTQLFCEYYLNNNNATEAARLSGYKGYKNAGKRLLQNPLIRSYVDLKHSEKIKAVQLSRPDFLLRLDKELQNAKNESTRARLLQLQADVLGLTKPDQPNTVNIFQSLSEASKMFIDQKRDNEENMVK